MIFSVSLQTWSQRVQPNIPSYSEAALAVQLSIMLLTGTNQRKVTGRRDIFPLNSCKQELLPANSGNAERKMLRLEMRIAVIFPRGRIWSGGKGKDVTA